MNYTFKLVMTILLVTFTCHIYSREVILISYETMKQESSAKFANNLFTKKYGIPQKLLSLKRVNKKNLDQFDVSALHIFITKENKIKVIKKNSDLIENSMKVFWE